MSQENKRTSQRFYEQVFNQGNLSAADELLAADAIDHNPPGPGFSPGREGVKQVVSMFRAAFPDLQL
ncbi:MAG TPA: ester cyclase, partial [Anaerolineales bacterium]|nr:ester cyclase [Anaerolineales bacterium]